MSHSDVDTEDDYEDIVNDYESDVVSDLDSDSDVEDIVSDYESDVEEDTSDEETETKDKPKDKPKVSKKSKNKLVKKLEEKIPSRQVLEKLAKDIGISIITYDGERLSNKQLFRKIKIYTGGLMKKSIVMAEKPNLYRNRQRIEQAIEIEKKLKYKQKRTKKEEDKFVRAQNIIKEASKIKIEKDKEEEKEKLKNAFKDEEHKRFDLIFDLSLTKQDMNVIREKLIFFMDSCKDEDNLCFERNRFVNWFQILTNEQLWKAINEYAKYPKPLSSYSLFIIHKITLLITKNIDNNKEQIQSDHDYFLKIEDSFITDKERKKLEKLKQEIMSKNIVPTMNLEQ